MLDDLLDVVVEIPDMIRARLFEKKELPMYKEFAEQFLKAVRDDRPEDACGLYAILGNDAWDEQNKLSETAGEEHRQFFQKYNRIFGFPMLRLKKEIHGIYQEFQRPAVLAYTFSMAEQAFNEGRYDEAEEMYIPSAAEDPKTDEHALTAVIHSAECRKRTGREDEARSYLLDKIEEYMITDDQTSVESILKEWPELRRESLHCMTVELNRKLAQTGACVKFGSYLYWNRYPENTTRADGEAEWHYIAEELDKRGVFEINASNGYVSALSWRIMDMSDDSVLLVSDRLLDLRPFYENCDPERETADWRSSDIRRWLNGDFYNAAFSAQEKEIILATDPDAEIRKPLADADKTADTDRVFLLSTAEARMYYPLGALQLERVRSTEYVDFLRHYGRNESGHPDHPHQHSGKWWLRPIQDDPDGVPFVNSDGKICAEYNTGRLSDYSGVLPAVWVKIG